ncbi:MAG: DUF6385 domain-containing protein, partial [Lawsonibacter sp.]|nr:DUF6385 domain-containing protein [Lawsonibacter sp.]
TLLTVAGDVTITNTMLTVLVAASAFTSLTAATQTITGTGELFNNLDISEKKVASLLLYNGGAVTIPLSLQISPTTVSTDYMNDPDYGSFSLGSSQSTFVVIGNFAHYARLRYVMGTFNGTITGYYQAQA